MGEPKDYVMLFVTNKLGTYIVVSTYINLDILYILNVHLLHHRSFMDTSQQGFATGLPRAFGSVFRDKSMYKFFIHSFIHGA